MSIDTALAHEHDAHGDVSVDETVLAEEIVGTGRVASPEVAAYALRLGDDALILSQQLSWWISRAPELEEDLALGNIALDLLGHARALLHLAGTAHGKSEDDLAFFRDEHEFVNAWIMEQPGEDFGDMIARQLIVASYQAELYRHLQDSADPSLAAIAGKAVREVRYHLDHAAQWTLRLAGGTEESRRRIIQSFRDVWPFVDELFENDALTAQLAETVPQPAALREGFDRTIAAVFEPAELSIPEVQPAATGGRSGRHSTRMGYLLAEMQWLPRRHPGAQW